VAVTFYTEKTKMTTIKKTIHNVETGEMETRPFTNDEMQQHLIDEQYNTDLKSKAQAKAQAKAVLLERLGLTQEEFNTLTA
jgi:hypothetical protein